MGSDMQQLISIFGLLAAVCVGFTLLVLFFIFVAVPLFRGLGIGIGRIFQGIGWFFSHIFEFLGGMVSDIVRFVGALIAMAVLMLMVPLNIVIGRWSAAGHFAEGVKRECHVGSACVYRVLIRRPLKLLMLHGVLEGLEQRVPEAMLAAPTSDKPRHRAGGVNQFDGYTILGSLKAGGSGAKLYVAEPSVDKRSRVRNMPERVVIKSFALTEGSSLPQIVRESRALECAKQLGHVFDHGMDEHRFFYVMPYHPGDHLGILTRQMHGESGGRGLEQRQLNQAMSYARDLLATLTSYHRGGLWHKDVKPENVIVHDGRAHLVDLGLVTPLRSAMTLTTHGTEYFRDPEMVRLALRGVRVHQVNGAKFDIYAAGAVLYFMIENTFPAHGGLSRFAAKSPEALRWIVRRAMTEYNQRYATADEMLHDLQYVMGASDAFALKPAELPSMRGESQMLAMDQGEDAAEMVSMAGNPMPPDRQNSPGMHGFGVAAGIGDRGAFAQVGEFHVDDAGNPLPRKSPMSKPRLTVTNWWTGEYRAEGSHAANLANDDREFRYQATKLRQQASDISRKARAGVISARKAAREQVKAARQRAKELRGRAHARRHTVTGKTRGAQLAVIIGCLSVLFLTAILTLTFSLRSGSVRADAPRSSGKLPVLLAVDSEAEMTNSLRERIKKIAASYRNRGYDVIEEADESVEAMLPVIRQWKKNADSATDKKVEDFLEEHNAYGVVYIPVAKTPGGKELVQSQTFVYSTRDGAKERRRTDVAPIPAPPAQPYLIINDHPAKSDLAITAEIERRLKAYREKGWLLVVNDDAEVKVRNVLPVGPIEANTKLSPMLHAALGEANLGGILRISGKVSDAPVSQRVTLARIDRDTTIPVLPHQPQSDIPAPIPQQPNS